MLPTPRPARCSQARRAVLLLCIALATPFVAATAHAENLRIGGTGAALGTMQLLANAYTRQRADLTMTVLPSMGSGGGIKAAVAGAVQIGVSARPLTDAEAKAGAVAHEYGRTPFVFATTSGSKAASLNTQDLVDIYAGTLQQWPDGTRIRLVMRPIGDSDSETIKAISPALRDAKSAAEQRKGMLFTVTDQETAAALEKVPGSLGPSTLALLLSEKRELKALALNGVVPDARHIADGSYPLYKTLYLVTGPGAPPAARAFVDFVNSAAGRDILQKTGHWVR